MLKEKFETYIKPLLKTGDALLFRGTGIVANGIQWADNAYWNHVEAVVFKGVDGVWYSVGSWKDGVRKIELDKLIEIYNSGDCAIVRPLISDDMKKARVNWCLDMVDENKGYDHRKLLLHLLCSKLKVPEFLAYKFDNHKKFVCSELFGESCRVVGMTTYKDDVMLTPQDIVRKQDENVVIIG